MSFNRKATVLLLLIIVMFIPSCSRTVNLKITKVEEFTKKLVSEHTQVIKSNIRYTGAGMNISYYLNSEKDKKFLFDMFYKNKKLILDKDFQKDFLKKHFKEYNLPRELEELRYPNICISVDINNDDKFDYQFETYYYKNRRSAGSDDNIDGYNTWYGAYKNKEITIPEKNETSKEEEL